MSVTTVQQEYTRLRSYLNPYIKGKNTDAILYALATAMSTYLVNQAAAVNDSMYIVSAQAQYLDELLAASGITRPDNVGLSDDIYSSLGISVKNRKQVRDLLNVILDDLFGDLYTKANVSSLNVEPYNLMNGDDLIINFDENHTSTITFTTSQFQDIAAALAQEVADAITKQLRAKGQTGTAVVGNNGNGNFIQIFSDTIGPASSVTVMGGSAQNDFIFPEIVPAGGNMSTQWTITNQNGGLLRFTWSGGSDPRIGKLQAGYYVNIFGGGFTSSSNEGSYTIVKMQGGTVNIAYFEINNPLGTTGIVVEGVDNAVLFYNPVKSILNNQNLYAALYQVQANTLQIFLPASTQIVRRSREGAAFIQDGQPSSPGQYGPYIYNIQQSFTIGAYETTLNENLNSISPKVIQVANSSSFPNSFGYLVLDYGSENQEGPIPYIATPSSTTILISPAYTIQQQHFVGANVNFISSDAPVVITTDGSDYPFYITDVVAGRVYAQSLINSVLATGITVVFTILYPSDYGIGKGGTVYSEISTIWGGD